MIDFLKLFLHILVSPLTNQSIIKDTFSISFDVASCYDMA